MHYVGRIRRPRRIRHQHAATLIPPFECQCFTLDQTHHQRQQAVDDQVNNPRRAKYHYIVGASVQQLAVSHHFHERNGVSQRGTFEHQHHFVGIRRERAFKVNQSLVSSKTTRLEVV